MKEEINYQCWICPKCHDDHWSDGPCTPRDDKPFTPAQDDKSYIAEQYRKLEAQLAQREADLESARRLLGEAREALSEIQCLAIGAFDMSQTKFNAMVTKSALKIAGNALAKLNAVESKRK